MYAVVSNKVLVYSGTDLIEALQAFNLKKGSTLHNIDKLEDLDQYVGKSDFDAVVSDFFNSLKIKVQRPVEAEPSSDVLSQAAQNLLKKLDEFGMNQSLSEKIAENSDRLVAEVRHIGTRGMKTVGDGFIALGDVLRRAYNK